jgi:hypothetical protein
MRVAYHSLPAMLNSAALDLAGFAASYAAIFV